MSSRSFPAADVSIAVLYEHPTWFNPLFRELDRRGVRYAKLHVVDHFYDVADSQLPYALLFNRISPSAFMRGHGGAISYTLQYLAHLEQLGVKVINGSLSFATEISKARQLSIFAALGLRAPRARLIHQATAAPKAAEALRFPLILKPNVGGSGAGIRKFETPDELQLATAAGELDLGFDRIALLQEFIPADQHRIVRVEVLGGRYLYAIRIYMPSDGGDSFNLCPGSICQTVGGTQLRRSAYREDAPKTDLYVEAFEPPADVIEQVERIMAAAHVDVGGVEYMISAHSGQRYFYDVNALSNFVADAPIVIGFDPFCRLVDYLVQEAKCRCSSIR